MTAYRMRIGYPDPGQYSMSATVGTYTVAGQVASLLWSGTPSDQSWSQILSGDPKSPNAGYITPVMITDDTQIRPTAVFATSTTGMVYVYFERAHGATGAISMAVQTVASTNVTAGVNYTHSSTTISYSDGEVGWKRLGIPILSIPTGFGLIAIEMTGSNRRHDYCYIWLQGTGHVPGAKYLQSLGAGVDSFGNTSGSGSSASPWASLYYATRQMGNAGGVLYVRNNASYKEIATGSINDFQGAGQIDRNCTVSSPLIIVSDPDNSGQPIFDNGLNGVTGLSNAQGICFQQCAFIWCVDIHVTNGNFTMMNSAGRADHITFFRCEADNYRYNGSNAAGFRMDNTYDNILANCKSHEIYSNEGGHNSNGYTAVPSGFMEGWQAFNAERAWVTDSTFDLLEFAVMQKDPPDNGDFSVDCHGLLLKRFQRGSSQTGHAITYQDAGGGAPTTFCPLVRYCVHDASLETASQKSDEMVYLPLEDTASGSAQPVQLEIYATTEIQGYGLINVNTMTNMRLYNNIRDRTRSGGNEYKLGSPPAGKLTQIQFSDNNLFVSSPYNFLTNYAAGTVSSNIAQWRTINSPNFVANSPTYHPDINSITTTTVPTYANQAAFDYRNTAYTGWAGRPMGVGNMPVGTNW